MATEQLTNEQALYAELGTVETVLDKGIAVPVRAPRWMRWLGKKNLNLIVRRPSCETLLNISRLYLKMKQKATSLNPEEIDGVHLMITECMLEASRIVAYGIWNRRTPLGISNKWLARHLRKNMDTRQLMELWTIVVTLSGAHDFSNIIRSMEVVRITKPKTT